jgi:polysaccharide pyruvyl transferase WcaK-like protein
VEGPVAEVTADPVMSMDMPDKKTVKQALAKHGLSGEERTAVFSVRPWKGLEGNFTDVFAKAADYVCDKHGMMPVLVPMNIKKDTRVIEEISNRMKNRSAIIREEEDAENLISIISCSKIVVGMRLHSLIYAAVASTPAIGIVYDPKVRFFIDMMEQVDGGDIESLEADVLCKMIDHVIENAATYRGKSAEKISMLRELSIRNAKMAIRLMESDPEVDYE